MMFLGFENGLWVCPRDPRLGGNLGWAFFIAVSATTDVHW